MGHYALPMAKEGKGGILVGEEGGGYGLYNLADCFIKCEFVIILALVRQLGETRT